MSCPEAAADDLSEAETCDRFHRGRFALIQPRAGGLRAGLDALLLAASLPKNPAGQAVDLGAGTGAVGFALAARHPALRVVLAERDAEAVGRARRALALPENAGFAARVSVAALDVLGPRACREAAGLPDGGFDFVVSNPPFHPPDGRPPADPARRAATAQPDAGFLGRWIAVAAVLLARRGTLALILRPDNLGAVLAASEGRLGDLCLRPVHTRDGAPATRLLVHARQGSRAPLKLLPPLVLRDGENRPLPIEAAISEGAATIDPGSR